MVRNIHLNEAKINFSNGQNKAKRENKKKNKKWNPKSLGGVTCQNFDMPPAAFQEKREKEKHMENVINRELGS